MKRTYFGLLYAGTLIIPAALYLFNFGGGVSSYSLSMLFGTVAFAIFANQFLLAAKPRLAVEALGTKGLLSFHGTMAVVGVVIAFMHKALKVGLLEAGAPPPDPATFRDILLYGSGFSDDTLQAKLGGLALVLFVVAVLLAALLMANTFWMKIPAFKKLKDTAYSALKLSYPRMREVHNIVALAFIVIIGHVLLASTSNFAANPVGAAWMILWAALCFGSYLRYRIAGRKNAAKPKKATQG
jgi:predicted ferric reductase